MDENAVKLSEQAQVQGYDDRREEKAQVVDNNPECIAITAGNDKPSDDLHSPYLLNPALEYAIPFVVVALRIVRDCCEHGNIIAPLCQVEGNVVHAERLGVEMVRANQYFFHAIP